MNKILIFFIVMFLIGCSQTEQLLYDKNYPLTNKIIKSDLSHFKVNIPQGWYSSNENLDNIVDIWLIEEKLSAQIAFSPLTVVNSESGVLLKDVLNFNIRQKKAEIGSRYKEVIPVEHFYINAIEFYSYQYYDLRNLPVRTVIFRINNDYFECIASFSEKINAEKANPSILFKVQNSVLNSSSLK